MVTNLQKTLITFGSSSLILRKMNERIVRSKVRLTITLRNAHAFPKNLGEFLKLIWKYCDRVKPFICKLQSLE
jgi:hypothetical protein